MKNTQPSREYRVDEWYDTRDDDQTKELLKTHGQVEGFFGDVRHGHGYRGVAGRTLKWHVTDTEEQAVYRDPDLEYRFNQDGFRDYDQAHQTGSDHTVWFFGDSHVVGVAVRERHRFANRFIARLNEFTNVRWQGVNFGVSGSSCDTVTRLYSSWSRRAPRKPNLVVVLWPDFRRRELCRPDGGTPQAYLPASSSMTVRTHGMEQLDSFVHPVADMDNFLRNHTLLQGLMLRHLVRPSLLWGCCSQQHYGYALADRIPAELLDCGPRLEARQLATSPGYYMRVGGCPEGRDGIHPGEDAHRCFANDLFAEFTVLPTFKHLHLEQRSG